MQQRKATLTRPQKMKLVYFQKGGQNSSLPFLRQNPINCLVPTCTVVTGISNRVSVVVLQARKATAANRKTI